MPPDKRQNFPPTPPDWVRQLMDMTAELAADRAADRAIAKHQANCIIADVKMDMYGTVASPGVKGKVETLLADVIILKKCKGFFRDIAKQVITALIISVIFWWLFVYRTYPPAASAGEPPTTQTSNLKSQPFSQGIKP